MGIDPKILLKLKEQIQFGPHITSALVDDNKKLQFAEVFGGVWSEKNNEIFELFLSRMVFEGFSAGLKESRLISVNICNVLSFETYQLKGQILSIQNINENSDFYFKEWELNYFSRLRSIGIPESTLANLEMRADTVVLIKVDQIFQQTPKLGTGYSL